VKLNIDTLKSINTEIKKNVFKIRDGVKKIGPTLEYKMGNDGTTYSVEIFESEYLYSKFEFWSPESGTKEQDLLIQFEKIENLFRKVTPKD